MQKGCRQLSDVVHNPYVDHRIIYRQLQRWPSSFRFLQSTEQTLGTERFTWFMTYTLPPPTRSKQLVILEIRPENKHMWHTPLTTSYILSRFHFVISFSEHIRFNPFFHATFLFGIEITQFYSELITRVSFNCITYV